VWPYVPPLDDELLLEELLLEELEDELLLDDELLEELEEELLDEELEEEDELLLDDELLDVPSHTPKFVYHPQLGQ
jgi:hypothetical protein